MSSTPSKTHITSELADFTNLLVQAVFGYPLTKIPQDKQSEAIKLSVKYLTEYVEMYLLENHSDKDLTRFKTSLKHPEQDIFHKFTDLGPKFEEAFKAFLKYLLDKPAKVSL